MKGWAEGYPLSTLQHYEQAAARGHSKGKWAVKAETLTAGERRGNAHGVRVHAHTHIYDEVVTMAEEQPNVRPYENVSGDVELVKHMDPVNVVCTRCRRAVCVSQDPAKATASHLVKCDGFCRYSVYHSASVALGEVPAKPSTFKVVYDEVLVELAVSVRRNKGVSSECGTCRVHSAVVELDPSLRTDDEYEHAKLALSKHHAVVQRFRGDERAMQMQSKRDVRLKNRDGVLHQMKDKAASENTRCPFVPWNCGRGKDANAVQMSVGFMMIAVYGLGVCIPLSLPWLKTKSNCNMTCTWVGFQLSCEKLGYVP